MNRKVFGAFFLLCMATFGMESAFGSEFPGVLKKTETFQRDKLAYDCEIHTQTKNLKFQVSIQTSNGFMEAELENGIQVKGFASETLDRKTQSTYYFLQGGLAPYGQQLTLVIREGGNWAEFRKNHGGEYFRCNL